MLRILLVPTLLLSGPALAESQSSDSSSNCSNGRCIRIESYTREGGGYRERTVTRESYREGRPARRGDEGQRGWYDPRSGYGPGYGNRYVEDPYDRGERPRRRASRDDD